MSSRCVRACLGVSMLMAAGMPAWAQTEQIQVAQPLRAAVAETRSQSATIAKQWKEISNARLVSVYIYERAPYRDASVRARTIMRRYSSGLLLAVVEIPHDAELPELLAHELEHVLEQIEGVNLAELARTTPLAARKRNDGAYETSRAQQAGVAAANETAVTAHDLASARGLSVALTRKKTDGDRSEGSKHDQKQKP